MSKLLKSMSKSKSLTLKCNDRSNIVIINILTSKVQVNWPPKAAILGNKQWDLKIRFKKHSSYPIVPSSSPFFPFFLVSLPLFWSPIPMIFIQALPLCPAILMLSIYNLVQYGANLTARVQCSGADFTWSFRSLLCNDHAQTYTAWVGTETLDTLDCGHLGRHLGSACGPGQ